MNPDALYRSVNVRQYRSAIADARRVIAAAIDDHGADGIAVAVSGGKDSVAMAHLVRQYCRPIILWNDSGLELPESSDIVHRLADMLGCELVVARGDAVSAWKQRIKDGRTDVDQKALFGPSQQAIKDHNIKLEFVGLREEESIARRALLRSRGPFFANKRWGCVTAFPMRRWTAADCLAYIDEHSLPLHPAYLREEWQARDQIRVSWAYDDKFENCGSSAYCRKYYPKLFRMLRDAGIIK